MRDDDPDDLIETIARDLREPVRVDPALEARVMARIRVDARRPSRARAAWRWLARPRTVAVSPLAGLAAAAGVAAIIVLGARARDGAMNGGARDTVAASSPVAGTEPVIRFTLRAPYASSVFIVGDFNDWDRTATPLRRVDAAGAWEVDIPLVPGRYQYNFVVDGRWVPDPLAPTLRDDFGERNSVITVAETST